MFDINFIFQIIYYILFLLRFYLIGLLVNVSKKLNKLAHIKNGNRPMQEFRVHSQNLPGYLSVNDLTTEIELLLFKYQSDVLILTEARSSILSSIIVTGYLGFSGFLQDGTDPRVFCYVKSDLKPQILSLGAEVPHIIIRLKKAKRDYTVLGFYREWSYDANLNERSRKTQEDRWCSFIDKWLVSEKSERSILIGDANYNYLEPMNSYQQSFNGLRAKTKIDIVDQGWKQIIVRPTRFQGTDIPALLDHVYVNFVDEIAQIVNKSVTVSDHNLVGVHVKTKLVREPPLRIKIRDFKRCDWESMKVDFALSGYQDIFEQKSPDMILDAINWKIMTALDKYCPERWITIRRSSAPWMSLEILELIKQRDKAFKKWRKSAAHLDYLHFKSLKTKVRTETRSAKSSHVSKKLSENDHKKLWLAVKETAGYKKDKKAPTKLTFNGELVTCPEEVAEIFNNGFKEKIQKCMSQLKPDVNKSLDYLEEYVDGERFPTFNFKEVTTNRVMKLIETLKNTAAEGEDGIRIQILKKLKLEVSPLYKHLINSILRTKKYPYHWSLGTITPVHKSGPRDINTNYRPVVILDSSSKIYDLYLKESIVAFLEENAILSASQHAYRGNFSCTSYWMELSSKIVNYREKGCKVGLVSLDLSSAFNCCSTQILIPKLKRLGFSEEALDVITAFMTNRRIRVKIRDSVSSEITLKDSTPEGGITSPNLFQILIVDFSVLRNRVLNRCQQLGANEVQVCEVESNEYADDCLLIVAAKDDDLLQMAIDVAYEEAFNFFSSNNLLVNSSKSELMVIGKQSGKKFYVNGIEDSETMKLVGLRFDNKMRFLPQARYVTQLVASKLAGLKKLCSWATFNLSLRIARSLILSLMFYLLEIFGHSHNVQVILQRSINHILRIVTKGNSYSKISTMLGQCNMLNIENQCKFQTCLWFRKCVENGVGSFSRNMLTIFDERTRLDAYKLKMIPKLKISEDSFIYQGARLYRDLRMSGVLFSSRREMKESIRSRILALYGNGNIT